MFPSIRTEGSSGWFGCWLTIQLLSQPFSFTTWRFTLENPFSSCWEHVEMDGGNGLRVWLVQVTWRSESMEKLNGPSFLLECSDMYQKKLESGKRTSQHMQIYPWDSSGRGATSKSLCMPVCFELGHFHCFIWIQQVVGHKEGNHVTWEMSKAFALTSETCKLLYRL